MATNTSLPPFPETTPEATPVKAGASPAPSGTVPSRGPDPKKLWSEFRSRIEQCRSYRRKLIAGWTRNIDMRRGKPFASQSDEDRIAVNLDWSFTKAKQASLFSQMPRVRINHPPHTQQAGPWLQTFEQKINDTLVVAGLETALDECLPDVINAAGIGAILCSHESITEQVQVPALDLSTLPPFVQQLLLQTGKLPDGSEIPMTTVPRVVDHRYLTQRISPADLLWPTNFTGADFDNAPWIGRSGRLSWSQAMNVFGLTEADKQSVLSEDRPFSDRLTHDVDKDHALADDMVGFDEIWYKEFEYLPDAKSYSTLHHVVFVHGKTAPVIDEPWRGQQVDDASHEVQGATKFPLRVLTLTYISDETIPPSDSAMGRSQVLELNKSRTQMLLQRERSLPIRTFDVNRVDTLIQQALMRGTWQGMIPVQGNGQNIITEVSRANIPPENFQFDRIAKSDLAEVWQVGANQQGDFGTGRQSASEANIVQANFATRIGRERAKVVKFIVGIAEVVGGLLTLYEDPQSFGQGFEPSISRALAYSILADSTVLLDSNQRKERIKEFIDFAAKSGFVNIEPVLKEFASLSGLDPNLVIQPPQPKSPVEPNISLRLTGVQDLMNPLTLACLMPSGQAPSVDLIEQAKRLIQAAVMPPAQGPDMTGQPGGPPPMGEPDPPSGLMPPQALPPGMPLPPQGQAGPGGPLAAHILPVPPPPPRPPIVPVGGAHPGWGLVPKVSQRSEDER